MARTALPAVLEEIRQRPETLYEDLGFVRDRQSATWRWVMRIEVDG